jgi:hypothetical protein
MARSPTCYLLCLLNFLSAYCDNLLPERSQMCDWPSSRIEDCNSLCRSCETLDGNSAGLG